MQLFVHNIAVRCYIKRSYFQGFIQGSKNLTACFSRKNALDLVLHRVQQVTKLTVCMLQHVKFLLLICPEPVPAYFCCSYWSENNDRYCSSNDINYVFHFMNASTCEFVTSCDSWKEKSKEARKKVINRGSGIIPATSLHITINLHQILLPPWCINASFCECHNVSTNVVLMNKLIII